MPRKTGKLNWSYSSKDGRWKPPLKSAHTAVDIFFLPAYRQKSLNGFGDNSVYLTVCRMSLWPR